MQSLKFTRTFVLLFALTAGLLSFSCNDGKSTVNNKKQEVNTETSNTNSQQPAPAKTEVPSGDDPNPSHGQPGHRCDIAVGAPLNSTPKNKQPKQNTVSGNPIELNKTNSSNLNPSHGQPGHRCDVAVGAPLEAK